VGGMQNRPQQSRLFFPSGEARKGSGEKSNLVEAISEARGKEGQERKQRGLRKGAGEDSSRRHLLLTGFPSSESHEGGAINSLERAKRAEGGGGGPRSGHRLTAPSAGKSPGVFRGSQGGNSASDKEGGALYELWRVTFLGNRKKGRQ